MDKKLLDIICCPVTRLPLELLGSDRLGQLNRAISSGKVRNNADAAVADPLAEALITRDGHYVYPVQDGIPVLLEEQSIDWNQVVQ
jgi:uncharacterized protein YbaR (Trm112 family)